MIIGSAIVFLVCNMGIHRLDGSPKVINLAVEKAFPYGTPTRPPLLHMDQ